MKKYVRLVGKAGFAPAFAAARVHQHLLADGADLRAIQELHRTPVAVDDAKVHARVDQAIDGYLR